MDSCVFCRIAHHELPAEVVYEDKQFIAFLDIHPLAPGHVQVIPKDHYRWVWDHPAVGQYFEVVKKIALAQRQAFNAEAIWSKVMGDEVAHAHVWIFPHPETPGDKSDQAGNAARIRAALQKLPPR